MSDTELAGILDQGLHSPFWRLFRQHVEAEWGAGGRRFEKTINDLADQIGDAETVVRQMQQVAVTRREILRLLKWPEEELRKVQDKPDEQPQRRAPLDPELHGQSRRGSL